MNQTRPCKIDPRTSKMHSEDIKRSRTKKRQIDKENRDEMKGRACETKQYQACQAHLWLAMQSNAKNDVALVVLMQGRQCRCHDALVAWGLAALSWWQGVMVFIPTKQGKRCCRSSDRKIMRSWKSEMRLVDGTCSSLTGLGQLKVQREFCVIHTLD